MGKTRFLPMTVVETALRTEIDLDDDESIVFVKGHRNGPNSVEIRIEE